MLYVYNISFFYSDDKGLDNKLTYIQIMIIKITPYSEFKIY